MFAGPWTFQEPASLAIFWSELKYILIYISLRTVKWQCILSREVEEYFAFLGQLSFDRLTKVCYEFPAI